MQMFKRKITRTVYVGQVPIGGGFPITVQSMTNVKTHELATLIPQIERLESAGCQLIRVAVPDEQAVKALPEIKKHMHVPLIADIHFDYRLALAAIDAGADKIRINPGNIGGKERIRMVLQKAKAAQIPIRVGVNAGSLEKDLLEKFGGPTAEALVASAGRQIELCRENDFENVVVALKAATVPLMINAYRLFAEQYDYPLHLGVTEAGPLHQGTIASCIGIGTLLAEGIGDTLRVSLTADPVEEVRLGLQILQMLEINPGGVRLVSCPTCGRTTVDLIPMVEEVADFVKDLKRNLTVAVMGCEVNGPGEAREADLGLAFGRGQAVLFRRGKIFARLTPRAALERLKEEIFNWQAEPDKEE